MQTSMRWVSLVAGVFAALALAACGSAQSRKAGYIQHGQKYFTAGNYDKARVEFRNAIQIDPKDATAHFMLAQVAEKTGNAREAITQYQAAVKADPKQAAARAAFGRLFLYGGVPDKAIELIEPGLATDPDNAQFLTVRGAARAQLGNKAGALEDAKRAVALQPGDDYAIALLSSLYKQANDIDQAMAVVKTGLTRLPNSVDLRMILADLELKQQQPELAEVQLRAIIALQPTVIAHRYRLARLYLQQKDVDSAQKTVLESVSSNPDSVDAKKQVIEFLSAQRGADKAVAQADQYLTAEPKNDKLKLSLGELLLQIGQPEAAERAFRAVIARNGSSLDGLGARDRLASLLIARQDYDAASAQIADVLKQSPRDNDALILRSGIALGRGQNQSAIGDLRAVLRDQPNSVSVMRTLAKAYQQNNESDQAEEMLRSAVQSSPKDFEARLDLAQELANANKVDQAEPLLEQLGHDNPASIPVQQLLFRVKGAQQRYPEALAIAQNLERTNPKMALGYYLAGMVDEQTKKLDEAQKDYEQALQLEPDAAEPLTALVRLQAGRKQPAAALARLNTTIAHSPKNAVARKLKADMLLAQGQTDAAIQAYQETVQVAPNWAQGYHELAVAQVIARHDEDAVKSLQDGIDKTEGAPTLVGDLSSLYERLSRSNDAIALYQHVLEKNPNSTFAANNLAMLLITYRKDSASLTQAQKLADQLADSSEPSMIDTRGWVRFKNGDFHGAESLLQQAVDKAPAAADIRYHLGMAQLRSGESQAARQNLQSALDIKRPFTGIDEARSTLAQLKSTQPLG